jgi:hypothetical protein
MNNWSVSIQTTHALDMSKADEIADELVDLLRPHGGTASYDSQMLAARFDVRATDPEAALKKAHRILNAALRKAGYTGEPSIIAVEVEAVEEMDRRLQESNIPSLVGIAEVAGTLGVSKQRASELSRQSSFPRPLATLAAGPVWERHAIARFLERWPRRRTGRPRKQAAYHHGSNSESSAVSSGGAVTSAPGAHSPAGRGMVPKNRPR